MKIRYIGHACFEVEENGYTVIFDPYAPDSVPGVRPMCETADEVFCSHEHADHGYREAVQLRKGGVSPFKVTEIQAYHDDESGKLRGENVIRVLESEDGIRVVHMGDIGHMPDTDQLKKIGTPDVMMIPVGGFFTVGPNEAKEITDAVKPRVIIPMHYRGDGFGYDVIGPLKDFTDLFGSEEVKYYESGAMEMTQDTPKQVAVLKALNIQL